MMYALFICDANKTWDSMRFIGIAHSVPEIREAARKLWLNEVIQLPEGYEPNDIRDMDLFDLVNNIDYWYVTEIGEILVDGTHY